MPVNDESDIAITKETRSSATAYFSNLTYSGFNGGVLNRVLNDAGLRNAYINQLFEMEWYGQYM